MRLRHVNTEYLELKKQGYKDSIIQKHLEDLGYSRQGILEASTYVKYYNIKCSFKTFISYVRLFFFSNHKLTRILIVYSFVDI